MGLTKLQAFARWCIQESAFSGGDLDGADVQQRAAELGLIIEEPFDPERHDPHGFNMDRWIDAGEPWFVFSGELREES